MTSRFPWPWHELDDCLLFHGSGATPTGGKDVYQTTGTPFVRSMNVYDLHFEWNDLAYIDESQAMELDRVSIEAGDVLLNITGASVARCCICPDQIVGGRVNQHVMILRADPARVEPAWLGRALVGPYKANLLAIAGSGATREALTKADIARFCVSLPPIEVQRCVVSVLQPFDDLIETNRRRIEILEETARLLYREWFVHFRYPGHEEVGVTHSDIGTIPSGWSTGKFSDLVCEITSTIAPDEIKLGTPVVGLEHLPRRSTTLQEWENASHVGSRRKVFVEGDILFGKIRPYFHKVVDAPVSGCSSTDAIVFRPARDLLRSRALAVASSDEFVSVATATSNGTRMPRANTAVLLAYGIPHPTREIEQVFRETVGPMDSLRKALAAQNRALRAARDLLLPRLISGELDASDLNLDLSAGTA